MSMSFLIKGRSRNFSKSIAVREEVVLASMIRRPPEFLRATLANGRRPGYAIPSGPISLAELTIVGRREIRIMASARGSSARVLRPWEDGLGNKLRWRRSNHGGVPQPRRGSHHVVARLRMVARLGSACAPENRQPAGP